MGYVPDWPPYQYTDARGVAQGVDIEAARRVLGDLGCPVQMVSVGWPRLFSMLEKGAVDMAAGLSVTPERADIARFSAPYRRELIGLYVRSGQSGTYTFSTLKDIAGSGFRLAVTAGSFYGDEFARLMDSPGFRSHVTEVQGADTPSLVAIGRVDGYLLDVLTAAAFVDSPDDPMPLERHPGFFIDNGPIHFAFSRGRIAAPFVDRVNAALAAVPTAGEGIDSPDP